MRYALRLEIRKTYNKANFAFAKILFNLNCVNDLLNLNEINQL